MDNFGAIAAALGHTHPAMYETPGGRWLMTCGCGYRTTTRRTIEDAAQAGVHHVEKAIREWRRNGGVFSLEARKAVVENEQSLITGVAASSKNSRPA